MLFVNINIGFPIVWHVVDISQSFPCWFYVNIDQVSYWLQSVVCNNCKIVCMQARHHNIVKLHFVKKIIFG